MPGTLLLTLGSQSQEEDFQKSAGSIVATAKLDELPTLEGQEFEQIVGFPTEALSESTAAKLLSLLQPGGALELTLTQNSESQFKELSSALLFSGFTLEERVPEKGVLVAKKPNWDSETVGVNIAGNKENGGEQAASAADAWGVSAVRAGKGDVVSLDDLLDEDELLAESEEVFREKIEEANKAAQECGEDGVMRRRACKNCHCGRAEMLEAEENGTAEGQEESKPVADGAVRVSLDLDDFEPPSGGCGSCSLGDAFRCATCPFLGKPAFKTTQEGGVVKLEL